MTQMGINADGYQEVQLESPGGATAIGTTSRKRSQSPPGYSEIFKDPNTGSTETVDQFGK